MEILTGDWFVKNNCDYTFKVKNGFSFVTTEGVNSNNEYQVSKAVVQVLSEK